MDKARQSFWVGYRATGGRIEVSPELFEHGAVVVGHRAKELTPSLVQAMLESSMRLTVVDIDGSLSKALSGYLDSYEASYVMHDSLLLDEDGQNHAALVTSAYATTMDLPLEQEFLLFAAVLTLALEEGEATPAAISSALGVVEGFKGPDKSELSGKIGTLRLLESSGDEGAVRKVFGSSCIIDFSTINGKELADASAALFMAKILSMPEVGLYPDALIVGEAQRLFRSFRIPRHSCSIRSALLGAPFGKIISSNSDRELDEAVVNECPTRFYSSDVWNSFPNKQRILHSMFMMQDLATSTLEPFVPRDFEPRMSNGPKGGMTPIPTGGEGVRRAILETVATSTLATLSSVTAYLSAEYPKEVVSREITRLQAEGSLAVMRPAPGTDTPSSVLRVTEIGRLYMKELIENDGENSNRV